MPFLLFKVFFLLFVFLFFNVVLEIRRLSMYIIVNEVNTIFLFACVWLFKSIFSYFSVLNLVYTCISSSNNNVIYVTLKPPISL